MHLNYTNPYDILLYRKRKTFEETNSLKKKTGVIMDLITKEPVKKIKKGTKKVLYISPSKGYHKIGENKAAKT